MLMIFEPFLMIACAIEFYNVMIYIQVPRNDGGLEAIVFTSQGDMRQVCLFTSFNYHCFFPLTCGIIGTLINRLPSRRIIFLSM